MSTIRTEPSTTRFDVIAPLAGTGNVGVELGVAAGHFSAAMVESGKFARFYGVDVYSDLHYDIDEYREALWRTGLESCYRLLRVRFDEALELFDDNSLDFVYVDGYAHSGEDGGETIFEWSRKLKVGGVLAGDDYHLDWPLVVEAVNAYAEATDAMITLTAPEGTPRYSLYPSRSLVKEEDRIVTAPVDLMARCKRANEIERKRRRRRKGAERLKRFARRFLAPSPRDPA